MFKIVIKIILLVQLTLSLQAKVSESKLGYLVDLLQLKKKFPVFLQRGVEAGIKDRKEIKLVKRAYLKQLAEFKSWKESRNVALNYITTNFNEREVNKMIAIFELPIMKKLHKHLPLLEKDIVAKFSLVKGNKEEDADRILYKKAQALYARKLKLIKALRSKKK